MIDRDPRETGISKADRQTAEMNPPLPMDEFLDRREEAWETVVTICRVEEILAKHPDVVSTETLLKKESELKLLAKLSQISFEDIQTYVSERLRLWERGKLKKFPLPPQPIDGNLDNTLDRIHQLEERARSRQSTSDAARDEDLKRLLE